MKDYIESLGLSGEVAEGILERHGAVVGDTPFFSSLSEFWLLYYFNI